MSHTYSSSKCSSFGKRASLSCRWLFEKFIHITFCSGARTFRSKSVILLLSMKSHLNDDSPAKHPVCSILIWLLLRNLGQGMCILKLTKINFRLYFWECLKGKTCRWKEKWAQHVEKFSLHIGVVKLLTIFSISPDLKNVPMEYVICCWTPNFY